MEWYLEVLKKYAVFSGRARRKEFWMFLLCNLIITIVLNVLTSLISTKLSVIQIVYALAIFIPSVAVTARRLHDIGRSGWWQLIFLIPFIGLIISVIWAAQDSQAGENQYGPNPKGA